MLSFESPELATTILPAIKRKISEEDDKSEGGFFETYAWKFYNVQVWSSDSIV